MDSIVGLRNLFSGIRSDIHNRWRQRRIAHYTTFDVFKEIVQGASLRAFDVTSMVDKSEFDLPFRDVERELSGIINGKLMRGVGGAAVCSYPMSGKIHLCNYRVYNYSASFTSADDSEPHWREYSGGNSETTKDDCVCIIFDLPSPRNEDHTDVVGMHWGVYKTSDIIYRGGEQYDCIVHKIAKYIRDNYCASTLNNRHSFDNLLVELSREISSIASFFKEEQYSWEKEIRALVPVPESSHSKEPGEFDGRGRKYKNISVGRVGIPIAEVKLLTPLRYCDVKRVLEENGCHGTKISISKYADLSRPRGDDFGGDGSGN